MRWVAFLRAINVGGRTVRMADLRAVVAGAGGTGVETFIASGNVLFEAPSRSAAALERRLEAAFAAAFGFEVTTMLRSPAELAAIAAAAPFGVLPDGVDGQALYVALLKTAPSDEGVTRLLALRGETDDFHVAGRSAWWLRRRRSDREFSGAKLERALGVAATLRNVTTVSRLAEMANRKEPPTGST
jgi:uncharacterized protein (DUF1697 family)